MEGTVDRVPHASTYFFVAGRIRMTITLVKVSKHETALGAAVHERKSTLSNEVVRQTAQQLGSIVELALLRQIHEQHVVAPQFADHLRGDLRVGRELPAVATLKRTGVSIPLEAIEGR